MRTEPRNETLFARFEASLRTRGLESLRAGLIGKDAVVTEPFGPKPMLYADYVASGRALSQVEEVILSEVLPYYSNSHTEASYCGAMMTSLRRDARQYIARACGAGEDDAVVFTGSGATAGLNRLVHLFGVPQVLRQGLPVRVVIGPYEHHSNVLPWRESGAEVIELPEAATGGPDQQALKAVLSAGKSGGVLIGAFSAASNVTGELTDVAAITRILNDYGALAVWDYAAGAPYLPISMHPEQGARIDALVLSPHKFIGGPGASGVTIVRRGACVSKTPSQPGGGTVSFVSPWGHDYSPSIEAREESGTPNVIGDLRAALAFAVKLAMGEDVILARNAQLVRHALDSWAECSRIRLLGRHTLDKLPVFSFRLSDGCGGYVHHQLVTRMLSDIYGIQARGGCACAGPYVHRLLELDQSASEALRLRIKAGAEIEKPGFVRLNLSVLMSETEIDFIVDALKELSVSAAERASNYVANSSTAIFQPKHFPTGDSQVQID